MTHHYIHTYGTTGVLCASELPFIILESCSVLTKQFYYISYFYSFIIYLLSFLNGRQETINHLTTHWDAALQELQDLVDGDDALPMAHSGLLPHGLHQLHPITAAEARRQIELNDRRWTNGLIMKEVPLFRAATRAVLFR